jgi:hypothetical protein
MPKKVFRLEDDEDEVPKPLCLIGIAGTVKYYKLCHYLNKFWELDFEMKTPIAFKPPRKQKTFDFIRLQALRQPGEVLYEVIANKESGEALLPEVANYDLLLKIEAELKPSEAKKLCTQIKQVPEVMIAAPIETEKLKTLERIFIKE